MNEGVVKRWTAWSFAVSGAGAVLWTAVAPAMTVPEIVPPRVFTPTHASSRPYPVDSLARLGVSRDPFRSARRPASVAYDPQRATAPVENQPPKPALALLGLVAGAEATAVIEGFPGVEGARVVRVGDAFAGIKVQHIAIDQVRLVGMDTVWVLRVREPWKP
jgi:hypothetical protein